MKFEINLQKVMFVLFLGLFMGFVISSALMNMVFYAGVLNVKLQYISIMMIIPVVVIYKVKSYSMRSSALFAGVLLALCMFQFLNLPAYTYLEAKTFIVEEITSTVDNNKLQDTRRDSLNTGQKINDYIDEFYYFEIEKNNVIEKILVNPMTLTYTYL